MITYRRHAEQQTNRSETGNTATLVPNLGSIPPSNNSHVFTSPNGIIYDQLGASQDLQILSLPPTANKFDPDYKRFYLEKFSRQGTMVYVIQEV